jgi:hypothetical protein
VAQRSAISATGEQILDVPGSFSPVSEHEAAHGSVSSKAAFDGSDLALKRATVALVNSASLVRIFGWKGISTSIHSTAT